MAYDKTGFTPADIYNSGLRRASHQIHDLPCHRILKSNVKKEGRRNSGWASITLGIKPRMRAKREPGMERPGV